MKERRIEAGLIWMHRTGAIHELVAAGVDEEPSRYDGWQIAIKRRSIPPTPATGDFVVQEAVDAR